MNVKKVEGISKITIGVLGLLGALFQVCYANICMGDNRYIACFFFLITGVSSYYSCIEYFLQGFACLPKKTTSELAENT